MPGADTISSAPHIALAGGGSGGHVTPALAVAEQIRSLHPAARVTIFTSGRDVDARVIESSGLRRDPGTQVIPLPLLRLPGFHLSALQDAGRCWRSLRTCRDGLRRNPPQVLMGTGGFASVPGLLAAAELQIPTVLLETNVLPGRANRWWSRRAFARLAGWPDENASGSWELVGVPLRSGFRALAGAGRSIASRQPTRNLLIVGGSQGARRLNQIVREALQQAGLPAGWKVLHQTGSHPAAQIPTGGISSMTTTPFINDMAAALREASIVISRAGAVTLAEIAATGCPAILLPLSSAAGNHQEANAALFEERGAAAVVAERHPDAAGALAKQLRTLLAAPEQLAHMSDRARSLHTPAAADRVARRLLDIAGHPLQSQHAA